MCPLFPGISDGTQLVFLAEHSPRPDDRWTVWAQSGSDPGQVSTKQGRRPPGAEVSAIDEEKESSRATSRRVPTGSSTSWRCSAPIRGRAEIWVQTLERRGLVSIPVRCRSGGPGSTSSSRRRSACDVHAWLDDSACGRSCRRVPRPQSYLEYTVEVATGQLTFDVGCVTLTRGHPTIPASNSVGRCRDTSCRVTRTARRRHSIRRRPDRGT